MYIRQYGLQRNPFRNAPGSTLFYTSYNHKGTLDTLVQGIRGRYGLHLVTGENGTGKTTMARFILMAYSHEFNMAYLGNPFVTDTEFFDHIITSFGDTPLPEASPKQQVDSIIRLLSTRSTYDLPFVLLVDEAHHLSRDIYDHLLVLANLQHNGVPMLQTVLLGLPTLQDMLSESRFGSLNQRIGSRCIVRPMQREETGKYINYRLNKAGCRKQYLFGPRAIRLVHKITDGKPRLINHLCSLALEEGARRTRSTIDVKIIKTVLKDPAYTALFFPDKTKYGAESTYSGQRSSRWRPAGQWAFFPVAALILTCSAALGAYFAATNNFSLPLPKILDTSEAPQTSGAGTPGTFLADLEVPVPQLTAPTLDLPTNYPVSTGRSTHLRTRNKDIATSSITSTLRTPASFPPTDDLPSKAAKNRIRCERLSQHPFPSAQPIGQEKPGDAGATTKPGGLDRSPTTHTPNNMPAQQVECEPPASGRSSEVHTVKGASDTDPASPPEIPTQSQRPDLPALPEKFSNVRLNALVWDPNPIQRMAVINSQILHEKSIFGRLTVLKISKGYVILGYANQRFLLKPTTR